MNNDIDVRTYFAQHAPQIPGVTVRAVNAVMRGGLVTMQALLAADEERLRKVRNLGEKCFALVLDMRKKYAEETADAPRADPKQRRE